MNVAGQDLPRRNPKTPEDTVFYSIYPDDITSSTPPPTAAASLRSLLHRLHSLLTPLLSTYIWQHEPFLLSAAPSSSSSSPCRLCSSPPMPHLHGKTRFGDNLNDEWFIVFLLFEISRAFPSLSIRVWDCDGEFLLIEAAFSLPHWLNPDSSPNRVFIRSGDLHIVPKRIFPSTPSLSSSLEAARNPEIDTKASDSVQSVLKKRISGYPEKARADMHRVIATVPLPVARVLKHEPCLISLAVEGFYDRDVDSMKDASRMEKFLGTEKAGGEIQIEMVRVSVEMSRAMYAQLVQQRFQAPRCYPMPGREEGPVGYKDAELGMKIACGFEMMYQRRRRAGKEGKGSTWEAFRESLERSGCFDGMLPGSKEYQRIMDNALECYRSSALFSRTRDIMTAPVKRIDEILSSVYSIHDFSDMHLLPSDDDSWLYDGEDELNSAIMERQIEMEAYESKHRKNKKLGERVTGSSSQTNDFHLKDVAESMQAFVRKVSSFEGAEVPRDWSKEVELDAELFLKEMESVLGPVLQEQNSFNADLEELNASSDMDFEDSEGDSDIGEETAYDDTEDTFMLSYSDALNQELSSTTLKRSFIRAPREPNTEDEGTSNAGKHNDEDLTPVDVDMNLVQNFLDSYASQKGLPGPASNLLGLMGLNVPADEKTM